MIVASELNKTFKQGILKGNTVHALKDVSLEIKRGETLAVLGPGGCGKTTLGRLILRLIKADSGNIYVDDNEITHLKNRKLMQYRLKMQLVSQHPDTSLNPRYRLYTSIAEPLRIHRRLNTACCCRSSLDTISSFFSFRRADIHA